MHPKNTFVGLALAGAAALAFATPAAAEDLPIQVIIQNNMPVPVYTGTEAGGSQCLRGIPGTTVPAQGVIYVTLWMTCKPMRGQQVFIPSVVGPEVRTVSVFDMREDEKFAANGRVTNTSMSVALWQVSVDRATAVTSVINPNALGPITKISWRWTLDCPPNGCPKP